MGSRSTRCRRCATTWWTRSSRLTVFFRSSTETERYQCTIVDGQGSVSGVDVACREAEVAVKLVRSSMTAGRTPERWRRVFCGSTPSRCHVWKDHAVPTHYPCSRQKARVRVAHHHEARHGRVLIILAQSRSAGAPCGEMVGYGTRWPRAEQRQLHDVLPACSLRHTKALLWVCPAWNRNGWPSSIRPSAHGRARGREQAR